MPTDLQALAAEVRSCRQGLDRQYGRAQRVAAEGKASVAEVERLGAEHDLHAKTAAMLTTIGEQAQEDARAMYEDLATRALQDIFGAGLSFHLVAGESGGQVTLEPVIRSVFGGEVIDTPVLEARGGGMAVVTGFVLQLVTILKTAKARKILFLDETFAHVSRSFIDRLAEFVREAALRTGLQVVMVTHEESFAQHADQIYRIALGQDGAAQVTEGVSELCRCPPMGR